MARRGSDRTGRLRLGVGIVNVRNPLFTGSCGTELRCPVVFVAVVAVMFERGEHTRFKLFIEPVRYVWVLGHAAV